MGNLDFYRGKRVLVTGHSGFKGTWLTRLLVLAGARVLGYSLESPTIEGKAFFEMVCSEDVDSRLGDVRDFEYLRKVFAEFQPEIVFHLAAQPIVWEGYRDPVGTYGTNVMGTVHLLECVRRSESVRSVVNVTTDKVYENREWVWGYRENDALDGFDPYSNSKSCSELVTHSFVRSFFSDSNLSVSTARAGNVIGGGDFSPNRILPDCIRSAERGDVISVRNPRSIRPYQHVLEPLGAYLLIGEKQYGQRDVAGSYNIGPEEEDCVTTGELATLFCEVWGEGMEWRAEKVEAPHEARFLKLDCSRAKMALGWKPLWDIKEAVKRTVEWAKTWRDGSAILPVMDGQIRDFMKGGVSFGGGEKSGVFWRQ